MYQYKTLNNTELNLIHRTFVDAFSDYQVTVDMPFSNFENMLKRRSFMPELSIGAFDDERLIGFVLIGAGMWDDRPTVYDLGTGVIPSYRKQGITSQILKQIKTLCIEKNIECFLLEVLQNNTAAVELYKKQKFETIREFECFGLKKAVFTPETFVVVQNPDCLSKIQWEKIQSFWNYNPSWQNSVNAVMALPSHFLYSVVSIDDQIAGYGIIEKGRGDIPQIAVSEKHRNRGIGKSILSDLIHRTTAEFFVVNNVDSRDEHLKHFLMKAGFEKLVSQYEMLLHLNP